MLEAPAQTAPSNGALNDELATYLEYNKILRSWLVAFGVGGPALFLVNSQVSQRLVDKHELRLVAALFLIGTGSQVIGAVVNKVGNWYVYSATFRPKYAQTYRFKFFRWLVEQFWIDVLLDVVTILVFGWDDLGAPDRVR